MDLESAGFILIIAFLGLIAFGVPLAFAIFLAAAGANIAFFGFERAASQLFLATMNRNSEFLLVSIPLFLFMGQLVAGGQIGRDLYNCVYRWLGWLPGGLAVTAVITCAAFGAVTGVSAAAIGTMCAVSLPEMRRYGYNIRLATGSIATASTLAILIPPSLQFIIYGIWTEQSIGKLFIAGVIPGIVLAILFSAYIIVRCALRPQDGPTGSGFTWRERLTSLAALLPIIFIFFVVVGGIYTGLLTPSESGGVGCVAVAVTLLFMRRLTWGLVVDAVIQSARLSIMIFAIFIAVSFLTSFLVLTDVSTTMSDFIVSLGANRYVILLMIVVLYIFLGMVLDPLGMMLLTLPFVYPIVTALEFDPIWFGVLLTILVELALITPPVGFNCYIVKQMAPSIPLKDIFLGIIPFALLCCLLLLLMTIFPGMVLWLGGGAYS